MSRGEEHNPASAQEQLRRQRQDWYYQVGGPPTGETDTSAPFPHDIIRVQLTADWYACDDGEGVEIQLDDDGNPAATDHQVILRDPLGIAAGNMLWDDATWTMPAGTYLWAIATYDGSCPDDGSGPYYEPLNFGQPPDCSSGSGSSGSGSHGSGSAGSGSHGSHGPGSGGSGSAGSACSCDPPPGYCYVPCPGGPADTGDCTGLCTGTCTLKFHGGVMSWVCDS